MLLAGYVQPVEHEQAEHLTLRDSSRNKLEIPLVLY